MSLAVPGLLLSGWAPARASSRPVRLVVRDRAAASSSPLWQGVELGLADVQRAARLAGTPVTMDRVSGDDPAPATESPVTVEVVVCAHDEAQGALEDGWTRIYTCALDEWRHETWSVASARTRDGSGLGRPVDWHAGLRRHGAAHLNARFQRRAGVAMDETAWHGWMAVKVAFEAAQRTAAGETDLLAMQFDAHKGEPLTFADDGHLMQPTYRIGREVAAPRRAAGFHREVLA